MTRDIVPAMAAVATREYLLSLGGEPGEPASSDWHGLTEPAIGEALALETLDLYLEAESVAVSTGARTINPFGL
jgi:hypothetical protein